MSATIKVSENMGQTALAQAGQAVLAVLADLTEG
jgi:hypothetical protein